MSGSTTAATAAPAYELLVREVSGSEKPFEYVLGYYARHGTWHVRATGRYTTYEAARRAGEAEWRARVGSLYTDLDPGEPVDVGDAGGDAQISAAYGRRFVRKLTDGTHYGVIDLECYVLNANPDPDGPAELVVTHWFSFTTCTDPRDLDGTGDPMTTQYFDIPLRAGQTGLSDETIRRLCARFDPAVLDWDGELMV